MADIKDSVGVAGAKNLVHDVSLVQAMLKVIKNTKGAAYLKSNYDGIYGNDTKTAIINFQTDKKLIKEEKKGEKKAAAAADKSGFISANGPTIKALNQNLPATHKLMRIIENTKTVYIEGDAKDALNSQNSITNDVNNLVADTRTAIGNLIRDMYKTHKIVLKSTATGRRRTFAQQAVIVNTQAGPGESNHNFGRAVDLGFKGMQWVQGDGKIKKDADWLNALEKANAAKANAFWDARDAIALDVKRVPRLFRLRFERVHLQTYNQASISSGRSLANLLNNSSKHTWEFQRLGGKNTYKSNLGGKKGLFNIGTAKQIFSGNAKVTTNMIATVKNVKITTVKAADVKAMKTELKNEFLTAETQWKKWKGIP